MKKYFINLIVCVMLLCAVGTNLFSMDKVNPEKKGLFIPDLSFLSDESFNWAYVHLKNGDYKLFKKEVEKREIEGNDLLMLLKSSIYSRDKKAFLILVACGVRLSKLSVKDISHMPPHFLDK